MTIDANSNEIIAAAAAKLAACSTWNTTLGLSAADIYYPSTDAISAPFAVIQPASHSASRIMEGAQAIPSGSLEYAIMLDNATVNSAQAEAYAYSLSDELVKLETGLYVSDAEYELSGEPEDGDVENYATMIITITYGLEG